MLSMPAPNSCTGCASRPHCRAAETNRGVSRSRSVRMTKIDVSDIQGFALKGYNFPYARYLLIEFAEPAPARAFLTKLLTILTTGERWDINNKPMSTVNLAFTFKGLEKLDLPLASLL